MLLSRNDLVSTLFCETDRAQRMKMPLALVKLEIVAREGGQSEPGDAAFDTALREIVGRITPLLRCYDSVGQMADREYLLLLPGCSIVNAKRLAERLRDEVFGVSVAGCAEQMRFKACYAVASSGGRSPLVVLRDVDRALQRAKTECAGSIQTAGSNEETDPAAFIAPEPQDEAFHT